MTTIISQKGISKQKKIYTTSILDNLLSLEEEREKVGYYNMSVEDKQKFDQQVEQYNEAVKKQLIP